MLRKSIPCIALALAGVAAAQQSHLSGPNSGRIFDPVTRSIRWIVGVPGAAYLGSAAESDLDAGSVSPDGRFTLASRNGEISLIRAEGVADLGSAGKIEEFAWSADGKSAAIRGASVRLYRNLDSETRMIELAAPASGIRAIAVEPGADAVLAIAGDGLYRLTAAGARLVATVEEPSALAVAMGTAYVASRSRNEILRVANYRDSADISLITSSIDDPAALATSADGEILLIAARAGRSISILRSATGEVTGKVDLDFEPTRIAPAGDGLFQLNSRSSAEEPVYVFDPRQRSVFFIPTQDLTAQAANSVED